MLRWIATTMLLALLGQPVAAQTPTVINLSCDGTVLPSLAGKDEGDPVKKLGLVVNLADRTVTISSVSVASHIDRADVATISFSATEVPYGFGGTKYLPTQPPTPLLYPKPSDGIFLMSELGKGALKPEIFEIIVQGLDKLFPRVRGSWGPGTGLILGGWI